MEDIFGTSITINQRKCNNIMKPNIHNEIVNWDDHLDAKYGKRGTAVREKYEEDFEAFKLGILLQEARKKQNLTQEELALKIGTTKSYISRIENDASDIRLTTLMRIVREGLGGNLRIQFSA
jgi:DNA-binding XRE family transcriptional regulator